MFLLYGVSWPNILVILIIVFWALCSSILVELVRLMLINTVSPIQPLTSVSITYSSKVPLLLPNWTWIEFEGWPLIIIPPLLSCQLNVDPIFCPTEYVSLARKVVWIFPKIRDVLGRLLIVKFNVAVLSHPFELVVK